MSTYLPSEQHEGGDYCRKCGMTQQEYQGNGLPLCEGTTVRGEE